MYFLIRLALAFFAAVRGTRPHPAGAAADGGSERARANLLSIGTAVTILGVLALGMILDVALVGRVRHDRDRQLAYAHFRYDLANGTAPTGAYDVDGKPLVPGTPVAVLEIPDIGVREVVSYGATSSILASGPGLRRDTVLPGQTGTSVVIGRRALYGGPFHYLDQLTAHSQITVTTGQAVSEFRVVDVRHAGATVPREFLDAPASLVLTTSDGSPFLPDDVIRVDAVLVDPAKQLPDGAVSAAAPADKALAAEGSAWVPLVFWGQGLVLAVVGVTWLRSRWGVRQSWLVGSPVLIALGLTIADTAARLLPNVM